jgi:Repeat of unknown function (DUF5648)
MPAFRLATALAALTIACLPITGAYAARTCSLAGTYAIPLQVQDLAFKRRIIDAADRPGANVAFFQSLGSPLATYESPFLSELNLTVIYSALVDVDPIGWSLETLPGIKRVFNEEQAIICPTPPPFVRIPVTVYELLNKRWGTYYYLTTDAEFRALKRQTGLPDSDWEWTDETFVTEGADGLGLSLCGGYRPVHRLDYRGADGYVSSYLTNDAKACGYAKSELGLVSRGAAYTARMVRAAPASACATPYTIPLYSLYNNREAEGRPNHRYTTKRALADQMVAQGWSDEGVAMCLDPQ